ncbi:acyltransferase [Actinomadura craniellae]|uniref:Acyltransferase n=1 Tax=Actinomadura craniellae TaxID=2231787 RepID=A0A365HBI6_9ACTN|nr:acyltransferase [Actinomadura craniellae]RAY15633.1 acyltransferase [Actinomadura craniellae]
MTAPPPPEDGRITGHRPALDGVRAVAALAVLLFHVAASTGDLAGEGALSNLLSGGEIGVPIFFALSGLLLYRPWAVAAFGLGEPPRTRNYLWKRALRLLPAYWALVVVCMLLYGRDHLGDPAGWAMLLTMTHAYDPSPWWHAELGYLGPKGMGQIWSLTVEAAFYAVLPVLAAGLGWWARRGVRTAARLARRLLAGLAACFAFSAAYTVAMYSFADTQLLSMWLPHYLGWFTVGMALAVVSVWACAEPREDGPARRFCHTVAASWGMCWTAAALLYCAASTPLTGGFRLVEDDPWTGQFHIVLYGLVALFLLAPVALAPADHPVISAVLANRVMRYLGKISYSVFLWQFVVIYLWFDLMGRRPFEGNLWLDFPVCALLTVAVAAASHRLIEAPAQRLRRGPPATRTPAVPLRSVYAHSRTDTERDPS